MFKRLSLLIACGVVGSAVFVFQNCAQTGPMYDYKTDQSSGGVDTTVDDQPHPPIDVAKLETAYDAVLADRYYIQSLFTDIFGPKAVDTDSTHLIYDVQNGGSPCSPYEDYRALVGTKYVRAEPMQVCAIDSTDRLVAQVNPKATVTREALVAHACSDLVSTPATLQFALAQISASGVPESTDTNVRKAFALFYRNLSAPDQGVIDSLRLMLDPAAPTTDQWAGVLHTLCISPQWQVL